MPEQENKLPEPQAGGTYIRNGDGSLTPVAGSQTAPADGRALRAPADPVAAPAPAAAPAQGPVDHLQE